MVDFTANEVTLKSSTTPLCVTGLGDCTDSAITDALAKFNFKNATANLTNGRLDNVFITADNNTAARQA